MRTRFTSVLLAVFALIMAAGLGRYAAARRTHGTQAEASKDVEAGLKKGDDLYKAGKYREAVDAYKQVLASDPNNDHALNYIGVAYSKLGDRAAAREFMKKRLDVPGQSPSMKSRVLQDITLLYWDEADLRLARQSSAPSDKPPSGDKAAADEAAMIEKLVAEGADNANKAIQIAPKSAKAYSLLSLLVRTAASLETDQARRKQLVDKADEYLRQSIQFYDASPQQQQSTDMFASPMVSGLAVSGDALVKLGGPKNKNVPDSLKSGKSGPVTVEVFINRDGKVALARPVSPSAGPAEAAVNVVNHWEFEPSTFDGHPVQAVEVFTFPEK